MNSTHINIAPFNLAKISLVIKTPITKQAYLKNSFPQLLKYVTIQITHKHNNIYKATNSEQYQILFPRRLTCITSSICGKQSHIAINFTLKNNSRQRKCTENKEGAGFSPRKIYF